MFSKINVIVIIIRLLQFFIINVKLIVGIELKMFILIKLLISVLFGLFNLNRKLIGLNRRRKNTVHKAHLKDKKVSSNKSIFLL